MGFARSMTSEEMAAHRLKELQRAADLGVTPGMMAALDALNAKVEDLHRKVDKLIGIRAGQGAGYEPSNPAWGTK